MPRFYFDVHDGVDMPDYIGKDFIDLDAARIEAVVLSGILLVEDPSQFWKGENWSIDVRDEQRKLVFTLQFRALVPPRSA